MIVPIVPDEARTFGMDALFAQCGIYSSTGQLYEPVDAGTIMYYREAKDGQILEEGITEAGSMSSFIAAGTAYATHGVNMIPFYIYYSMFGFQRIGDLIWAAADARTRASCSAAPPAARRSTARLAAPGRPQPPDRHRPCPTVAAYDPAFAYELAVIMHDGMRRMYEESEDVLLLHHASYNENYAMPRDARRAATKASSRACTSCRAAVRARAKGNGAAQLFGSGPLLHEVRRAQEILAEKYGVASDVWSVTSYNELLRDALALRALEPAAPDGTTARKLRGDRSSKASGPFIAVSDYMRLVAEQIRPWVPGGIRPLGTDGFGRSETRAALRRHFEVDAENTVYATLSCVVRAGSV